MQYIKKINIYIILSISTSLILWSAYASVGLQKYFSHQTRGDLTAYAQGLWNTLHGNPFASTFNYSVHEFWGGEGRDINEFNSNIFGIHFNGVLLLLLPLFFILPYAETLIFLQAGFVATSSFIIFQIARKILKSDWLSLLIQISYLLHLSLITAVLSEFHAYPLTVLFSAFLIWTVVLNKKLLFSFFLILLLSVQENAGLPAFFFGLYLAIHRATRTKGLTTMFLGISSLLLTTKYLIPAFSPLNRYMFENSYGTPLGSSYSEMIINSVKNPLLLLKTFINEINISYLSKITLPVLPIVLLAPFELMIGILALLPNLISSASILKSLTMHYEAVAIPFLYFAFIKGLAILNTKFPKSNIPLISILIVLLPLTIQYKQLTSRYFSPRCVWSCQLSDSRDSEIDQMLSFIPKDASVSTQDYLSGHLYNRHRLYLFPVAFQAVEYLPLSKRDETWPLEMEKHLQLLQELRVSPNHTIIFESEHYILFKKS